MSCLFAVFKFVLLVCLAPFLVVYSLVKRIVREYFWGNRRYAVMLFVALCLVAVFIAFASMAIRFDFLSDFQRQFAMRYKNYCVSVFGKGPLVFIFILFNYAVMLGPVFALLYGFWFKMKYEEDSLSPDFLDDLDLRAKHVLVLGTTGSGKTTTVIEPMLVSDIKEGRGLIFMTAKEEPEFLERVMNYAVANGRGQDVQIFTLSDFPSSHSYNPLSYGDANSMRDMLFDAFTWDSPYYRDQSKTALLHVLEALVETGKVFSLRDLYYLFSNKTAMENLLAATHDNETKFHLTQYVSEWKVFHENTRGLVSNLEDYAGKRLVNRLGTEGHAINLIQAYNSNKIVLIVLNSLQYGETARCLGRMIIQNLKTLSGLVSAQGMQASFFPCYIDEFHHFVYPQFFSMVAQCRSSNIGLALSTQSFADMKNQEWDITTQVVQNTNTKIILRQNDAEGAELVARLAGTKTTTEYTEQYESHWLFGNVLTGLGSKKDVEEFVIHPNAIKKLGMGWAAVIIEGHGNLVKFGWVKDKIKTWYNWYRWREEFLPPVPSENHSDRLEIFETLQQEMRDRQGRGVRKRSGNSSSSASAETRKEKGERGIDALKKSLETEE